MNTPRRSSTAVRPRLSFVVASTLAFAACSGSDTTGITSEAPTGPTDVADVADTTLDVSDWDAVLEAADGQSINWYVWGGADSINTFVDDTYGPPLAELGITLNRVAVADTADAVNQVLAEQAAGDDTGAVDMIWINGENFLSLKDADLLFDGWGRSLPNSDLVDFDNPAVSLDFGEPIGDLEVPWSSAQFQFVYDAARLDDDALPRSYADLAEFACTNPGRVTYIAPGPGAFQGTRFVKGALFELSGGAAQWAEFDQALFDEWAPQLWEFLNDLAPCLWRGGDAYPQDENELHALFANGEVDFSITQAAVGAGTLISDGLVPDTARAFVFDDNAIGDFNYVTIPSNASNKAAALVLANLLLDPTSQAAQIKPENGFGLGFGIDPTLVADADTRAELLAAADARGPAATPAADLAAALVGDGAGEYQELIEAGWRTEVVGGL